MSHKRQPGRVWSMAPPGSDRAKREILVAGRTAPDSATRNRSPHMRRLLGSRRYVWSFALLAGGTFLVGSAMKSVLIAAGGPAFVALATVVVSYLRAANASELDFFAGFANRHGYTYTHSLELLEVTPLLGAGDRRRCDHYMEGPLSEAHPDVHAGIALYTFEERDDRKARGGRVVETWTPYKYTICVVELQRALKTFPGVFLSQRRGLLGRIASGGWIDYDDLKPMSLESAGISNRYELHVRPSQDRTRLMELFQPSFQVWLANLPLPICFEFSGGTLVTYVPKHLRDATSLDIMLAATAKIADRIISEGEPLQAAPEVVEFPPPPPSTRPQVDGPGGVPLTSVGSGTNPLHSVPPPATPHLTPVPDLPPGPSTGLPPGPPPAAG
ncbi:MAG: hypothetical protein WAP35_01600 [Solirubrobacterales bacterium]